MEGKKGENLNWFLIRNFIILLLFIAASEIVINFLITAYLFPFLNSLYGVDLLNTAQTTDNSLIQLLTLLGWMLCSGLGNILPGFFSAPFSYAAQSFAQSETSVLFQGIAKQYGSLFATGTFFLLFLILLVYILPYVIAAFLYSRVISHHVQELRREDEERREEFNRSRNLLLSDITHDLKTPITTISGYAQALSSGMIKEPEKQSEYLEAISNKSLQMSRLVTLLFEYITLDSEDFKLKKERENIPELILEIVAEHYSDIENAGMELELQVPERAIYLEVDRLQFTRAMENLLLNAAKHNPPGTHIGIILQELEEQILISVADTGSRIEEALIPHLFDPFVMGDKSRHSRSGSGLGLSIAAKVMELHGGSLRLKQPAGKGFQKSFTIVLHKNK